MSDLPPKLQPQQGEPGTVAVTAAERKGPQPTYVPKLSEEQPKLRLNDLGVTYVDRTG